MRKRGSASKTLVLTQKKVGVRRSEVGKQESRSEDLEAGKGPRQRQGSLNFITFDSKSII